MIRRRRLSESMILDDQFAHGTITMNTQLSWDSPSSKELNLYIQTDSMMTPKLVCTVGPFDSVEEKIEFIDKYANRILSKAEYDLEPSFSSIRSAVNIISGRDYGSKFIVM